MKKAFVLLAVVSILFCSCANDLGVKRINPETKKEEFKNVEPYGVLNKEAKVQGVKYEINVGNVLLDIIFSETIVVPVVLVGWQLYEPVGVVDTTTVFAQPK